ncbi:MAG: hypothetical protein OXF08_06005 [Bacteroidetes bacterium]|nr:hypothetical protein [Bacteroidota bacterium]
MIEKKESPNAERIQMRKLSAYDECTDASGGYVLHTSHSTGIVRPLHAPIGD